MPLQMKGLLLLVISTFTVMAGATIAPALPGISEAFQSESLAKLVLTLPALTIALTAPCVGFALPRVGKKNTLLVALAVYGVAGISSFFYYESLVVILAGRIVLGLAVAAIMVSATTLIADYFAGPERGRYLGLQAAFSSFGGVLFMGIGSLLALISWRAPFLIYVLALVVLPFAWRWLYEPKQLDSTVPSNMPSGKGFNATVVLCCSLAFVEVSLLFSLPLHFPFYGLQLGFGSGAAAGAAITFMLLVMSVTAMNYHRAPHWASFPLKQSLGMLPLALGFALLAGATGVLGAIIAMLLCGLGLGIMRPNIMVWLMSSVAPNHRSRVMGVVSSCIFMGQFLTPVFTQPIIRVYGYGATFGLLALVLFTLAAAMFMLHLKSKVKRNVKNPLANSA